MRIEIGEASLASFDGTGLEKATLGGRTADLAKSLASAVAAAGYPAKADPTKTNLLALIGLLSLLNVFVALASAPLAAWMIELFPTRIRYSGASLSYQLAGLFAGAPAPIIATLLAQYFPGSYWPLAAYIMLLASLSLVSIYFLAETRHKDIAG